MKHFLLHSIAVLFAAAISLTVGIYIGQATQVPIEPSEVKEGYSLLTWESRSHDLCFALIPKYKREKFARNWFSKWDGKCGVSRLMEELSTLPRGTYVEWNNWPPRFILPRQSVAERLGEFAKSKGIEWHENPMLDAPMYSDWGDER